MAEFKNSTEFQNNYVAQNYWRTSLSADLNIGDTVVSLTSVSGLPAKGWVWIDREAIYYDYVDTANNKLGSTSNPVIRGAQNTTEAFHEAGAAVHQRVDAGAINTIMSAIKKRKEYTLSGTQVGAGSISTQSISGFASRARIADLQIFAKGGSQDFVVEFYRYNTFKAIDRLYKTINLNSVETTLSQATTAGDTILYLTDTSGFTLDSVVAIGNFPAAGSFEYGIIKEIVAGSHIVLYDPIANGYAAGDSVIMGHRDQQEFYYENLDWTAELHTRILNNDMVSPVTVHFHIIAETSDE